MQKLSKIHKDYIIEMIKEKESLISLKSYCKGAGFDTTNYSSPIHISNDGKLTIRYRTINTYYYINL